MIMLVLMSTGLVQEVVYTSNPKHVRYREGWNAFMHDYTVADPLCSLSDSYLFSDCGSPAYAFTIFITWNIISMYIFVNMLTGVVV